MIAIGGVVKFPWQEDHLLRPHVRHEDVAEYEDASWVIDRGVTIVLVRSTWLLSAYLQNRMVSLT